MCTVSNLGDQYGRDFPERWPNIPIYPQPAPVYPHVVTTTGTGTLTFDIPECVSKEDFDALKAEVEQLKILLLAAKQYDEATGQPDCEMDEKVELIRRVADLVGVDVDEVFGDRFQ